MSAVMDCMGLLIHLHSYFAGPELAELVRLVQPWPDQYFLMLMEMWVGLVQTWKNSNGVFNDI